MLSQQRNIDNRPQVNTRVGSNQTSVFARPVDTYIAPAASPLAGIGAALERLAPGIQDLFTQQYVADAEKSIDKGNLLADMHQPLSPDADKFEFHGYAKAKAIQAGLDAANSINSESAQILPHDKGTWGDYPSVMAATEGMIQARTQQATEGLDPKYAAYVTAGIQRSAPGILNQKQTEVKDFVVNGLTESVSAITHATLTEHLQEGDITPETSRGLFDSLRSMLTQDGLVNMKDASQIVSEQFAQFAIDNKNPDLLDFMNVKDKSGIALAQTASGDTLRKAQGIADKALTDKLDHDTITNMAMMEELSKQGQFSHEQVNDIIGDPVLSKHYSNEQLASMWARSLGHEFETKTVEPLNFDAYMRGEAAQIEDGAEKKKMQEAALDTLQKEGEDAGLPPQEILRNQIRLLSKNGDVSKRFQSIINNGVAYIPEDKNAPPPESFTAGVSLFQEMYKLDPGFALRHLTDANAKARILRFNFWESTTGSKETAWAQVKKAADKPLMEQSEYASSGASKDMNVAVDDYLSGEDIPSNSPVASLLRNTAYWAGEMGADPEQAIKLAEHTKEMYYKEIGDKTIYTGGNTFPDDFDKFSDWYAENTLKKDPDTVHLIPSSTMQGVLVPVDEYGLAVGSYIRLQDEYNKFRFQDNQGGKSDLSTKLDEMKNSFVQGISRRQEELKAIYKSPQKPEFNQRKHEVELKAMDTLLKIKW